MSKYDMSAFKSLSPEEQAKVMAQIKGQDAIRDSREMPRIIPEASVLSDVNKAKIEDILAFEFDEGKPLISKEEFEEMRQVILTADQEGQDEDLIHQRINEIVNLSNAGRVIEQMDFLVSETLEELHVALTELEGLVTGLAIDKLKAAISRLEEHLA